MARPKLPPGEARDVVLRTRVKPRLARMLDARRNTMTRAEVLREALADWVNTHPESPS